MTLHISWRCCAFRAAVLAVVGVIVAPTVCMGQWWVLEGRRYFDPLPAGVREAQVNALALAMADRVSFLRDDKDPRQVWDIDLGVEMPVLGWESDGSESGTVANGGWGAGGWIFISFHMMEDFIDDSSPIINTDYRFGAMVKVQLDLGNQSWLGFRGMVGHESTHLGDEFSIRAQEAFPDTFERINVTWEYVDLAALWKKVAGTWIWSARGGLTATVPFGKSYYSTDAASVTDSPIGPVTPSKNSVDPYAGATLEKEGLERIGLPEDWSGYVSGEARFRSVFDYHKTDPESSEDRQISINVIGGLKSVEGGVMGRVSPFVRFYHGVNPHGQFRDQKCFTLLGVGLRLAL